MAQHRRMNEIKTEYQAMEYTTRNEIGVEYVIIIQIGRRGIEGQIERMYKCPYGPSPSLMGQKDF